MKYGNFPTSLARRMQTFKIQFIHAYHSVCFHEENTNNIVLDMFCANYTLTFKFHVIQCAFSFGVLTPICVHSISFFSLLWFSCVVNGDECFCSTFPNPKSVSNQETERHTNTSTHARQRREQKNDSSQYANRSCSHTHTAAHLKCLVSLLTMIHFAMGLPFRCFRLPVLCFFFIYFQTVSILFVTQSKQMYTFRLLSHYMANESG